MFVRCLLPLNALPIDAVFLGINSTVYNAGWRDTLTCLIHVDGLSG